MSFQSVIFYDFLLDFFLKYDTMMTCKHALTPRGKFVYMSAQKQDKDKINVPNSSWMKSFKLNNFKWKQHVLT